jgi:hypothetical protein
MFNYEIDLCDDDGNTTHKGEYSIELDYQPEELAGGFTFVGECATVSSITGPDGDSVEETSFKAMYEEMHDVKLSDEEWQGFLLGLLSDDSSGRFKNYSKWW